MRGGVWFPWASIRPATSPLYTARPENVFGPVRGSEYVLAIEGIDLDPRSYDRG
jgi:hypothetical protein